MRILVTSLLDLKKIPIQRPHYLIKYLLQRHDITILCANAWWLDELRDRSLEKILNNAEFFYLSRRKINSILQEIIFYREFKTFRRKFVLDKFDLHLNLNSPIAGYFIARKLKLPTVFDIFDDYPNWTKISPQVPSLLKPFGKLIGQFILNKNVQVSTKVTYITRSLNNLYKFPQNKARLIPNGVDTKLFYNRNSSEIRKELGIAESFILGYVGGLKEWVDLEPVFRVLKILDNEIKMVVVGKEGRFKENVELAKKSGVADRVIFTGVVPNSEVSKYISAMDICLIPFKVNAISQNSLPLKLFEYMACEKPVISTPLAGIKEAVGDEVLYASNAEELKQRILKLYHNEELRTELGQEGREFVEQNYSWDKICKKFEGVLIEACEKEGDVR